MKLNSHATSSVTVRILKTINEIEEARPIWEAMQSHPNADIDFYLTIIQVRKEVVRPHVVIVLNENRPVAMAVARIEDVKRECKLGYKTMFSLKVRSLTLLHGGIFGDLQYLPVLIESLYKPIRKRETDVLLLSQVRKDVGIWDIVEKESNILLYDRIGPVRLHWQVDVSISFEEYKEYQRCNKEKDYQKLPRPMKRWEKDYPGEVIFKCFKAPDEVSQLCRDVEYIASKTYQRGLRAGFLNYEEEIRRNQFEADRGWLRVFILYVKREPVAFRTCTQYKRTLYLNHTGYSSEYRKYEPGTTVLLNILESCFSSEEIDIVDFGSGDAVHKRRFGTQSWDEETLQIYSLSPRGVVLYAAHMIIGTLERIVRTTVQSLGIEQKLKRLWRNQLSQK